MTPRQVFFVSDSTGITAETLGNSVLTQFDGGFVKVRRPFIATVDQAVEVIKEIAGVTGSGGGPLVFLTVMDRDVRLAFDGCPGLVVDLLEHSVSVLEAE
jgi:regulator of PEP synthase PpsR (kinase-PPPase family)